MSFLSAALLLFLVMDPFGNIPFFLTALKDVPQSRRRRVMFRELSIALLALTLFLFAGQYVLRLLHISEPSLTLAGGIILFLISLKMVFPPDNPASEKPLGGEPFIVPLAIPYLAGPSALSSVLFIMSRDPGRWPVWLAAIVAAWMLAAVILFAADAIAGRLGSRTLVAIERLMGMLLVTLAVQMTMTGIQQFLEGSAPR